MEELKKTCLYDKHIACGGKIVEFGGFLMPIEYVGITEEHQAVRNNVGLFDVSHMGEVLVTGADASCYLDYMVTSSITTAPCAKMTYGVMLYENGCCVDDLMMYKYSDDKVLVICNASNTDKDFEYFLKNKGKFDVKIENLSDKYAQLALQGPNAINIMAEISDKEVRDLKLFDFKEMKVNGKDMLVSRSGYTGEDGFEIYGSPHDINELFDLFVNKYKVQLCGLGCRDTLRFEANMPLYGHEINNDINPVEACLNYAICYDKEFIGRSALLKYKENQTRKLVGLELIDRGIARGGYELCDLDTNEVIGYITTGYMIPKTDSSRVDKPVALGYVKINYAEIGKEIGVIIRGRVIKAKIRDKKFMKKKYVK